MQWLENNVQWMYWTIKINLPHAIILSPISTHCSKISFSFFHLFPFPLCEQLGSKRSWRRNFCPLGKEKIIQAWKKVQSWKTKKLQTIKNAWDCHEKKGISMKMLQRKAQEKENRKQAAAPHLPDFLSLLQLLSFQFLPPAMLSSEISIHTQEEAHAYNGSPCHHLGKPRTNHTASSPLHLKSIYRPNKEQMLQRNDNKVLNRNMLNIYLGPNIKNMLSICYKLFCICLMKINIKLNKNRSANYQTHLT